MPGVLRRAIKGAKIFVNTLVAQDTPKGQYNKLKVVICHYKCVEITDVVGK